LKFVSRYNDRGIKDQLKEIIRFQLEDNMQAVFIDNALGNVPPGNVEPPVRSQQAIFHFLQTSLQPA
jgi:hypothetical protein